MKDGHEEPNFGLVHLDDVAFFTGTSEDANPLFMAAKNALGAHLWVCFTASGVFTTLKKWFYKKSGPAWQQYALYSDKWRKAVWL